MFLVVNFTFAQKSEQQINPLLIDRDFHVIKNEQVLKAFFKQLDSLQDGSKKQLRIVHIGDSHLQGPYFPKYVRDSFQSFAGNAGRGFVFPYRVAGTNGAIDVKFKSVNDWKAVRNVKSDGSDNVGLSGINLETTDKGFLLEMNLADDAADTRLIEIISPHPERFKLSLASKKNVIKSARKFKIYKVRSGDYLGKIARTFDSSVSEIKKLNGFKSDRLNAGQIIKVPSRYAVTQSATDSKTVFNNNTFSDLKKSAPRTYILAKGVQQVYIRAAETANKYVLDGLILSNNQSGILYHAIGVNGTKFSDYNKFPRFFDQLKALDPDLIIISLGTNESFYTNYTEEDLKSDMDQFNRELLKRNITGNILMTSPPPSMKNKRTVNDLATAFSYEVSVFANLNSWAFYDLHSVSGTSTAMEDWYEAGLASSDRIHFLENGYRLQAQLLVEALLNSFENQRE